MSISWVTRSKSGKVDQGQILIIFTSKQRNLILFFACLEITGGWMNERAATAHSRSVGIPYI